MADSTSARLHKTEKQLPCILISLAAAGRRAVAGPTVSPRVRRLWSGAIRGLRRGGPPQRSVGVAPGAAATGGAPSPLIGLPRPHRAVIAAGRLDSVTAAAARAFSHLVYGACQQCGNGVERLWCRLSAESGDCPASPGRRGSSRQCRCISPFVFVRSENARDARLMAAGF